MHLRVTCGTERNQVLLGIVSGLASMLFMVDLKVQLSRRKLGISSRPSARLVDRVACTIQDPAADADVLVG